MSDFPVKDFVKGISFERATFPKVAFGKEEILAGVVAALRTKQPEKIYPVGNLRCTTLPIRGKFQHTSTWGKKSWIGYYTSSEVTFLDYGYLFYLVDGNITYSKTYNNGTTYWLGDNGFWYGGGGNSLVKYGEDVWTDGTDTYYSNSDRQYIFNKDVHAWREKTWNISFSGRYVWSDGTNIYYTEPSKSYVLVNGNWEEKTWNVPSGYTLPYGNDFWSDGYKIYATKYTIAGSTNYVLDGDTFDIKEWNENISNPTHLWSDGTKMYCSNGTKHYVLVNGKWKPKTWNGATNFSGSHIWTDLTNIYIAKGEENYVLR